MQIQTLYRFANEGRDYLFAIETSRGSYVAGVDRLTVLMQPHLAADPLDHITVWHPVPRWMYLTEAVNSLIQ